jgi:hypothetical protein
LQPLDLAGTLPALFGGGGATPSPKKHKQPAAAPLAASNTKQNESRAAPPGLAESQAEAKAAALAVSRFEM